MWGRGWRGSGAGGSGCRGNPTLGYIRGSSPSYSKPSPGKTPRSCGEKGDGMFITQPRNKWEPLQRCIIQQLQLFVFSDTPLQTVIASVKHNQIIFFFSFFLVLYINRANKRENSAVPCNKENSSKLLMLFEKSSFNKVSKNHFLWLSVDSPVCSQ